MMGRDPRYILPNSLQHVVDKVTQSRFLLNPSGTVNTRYLGVLGRAQKAYDMKICAVVVLSNHHHLLLQPRDGAHLAAFMCFLKTNLAKEIGGRLRDWKGHFFDRRYQSITVSDEEAAQVRVLRYVLSNGVKEFLVDRVQQWPGVHSASSSIDGKPMEGRWFDRSREHAASMSTPSGSQQREEFPRAEYVDLSPLPCWEHLPERLWRRQVEEMVDDIDREVAQERRIQGRTSLGVAKVLARDPLHRPERPETSPQPRFHVGSLQVLANMLALWRHVIRLYREASEALRSGRKGVDFPEGTFPPSLPFVPFASFPGGARGHP